MQQRHLNLEESNGYEGLQRIDRQHEDDPDYLKIDTCGGRIPGDTPIF